MTILRIVNYIITALFLICYSYQFFYIPVVWLKLHKHKPSPAAEMKNRFAVLICARNESLVIPELIKSIKDQTYPSELVTVFVMADNCTDNTAEVSREAGAKVYERYNTELIGKGYALEELLGHIKEDYPECFDGYFVFDADNILASDYIERMNNTFSEGNEVVTSYRNSKNFDSNWVSAGYALWFLRESRYLNHARSMLGTSSAVSGTGFMFSQRVLDDVGGWPFHLLTEDIEFSINRITKGEKIAICPEAEFYDEQPVKFMQSWRQRMRWTKGYIQVFQKYGKDLIKGIFRGNFSCFDMAMSIMPAFILTTLTVVCNITLGIIGAIAGDNILLAVGSFLETIGNMYLIMLLIGSVTMVTEWKHIDTSAGRKIWYTLTFPLFMATFIPIAISALFCKVTWKPIEHSVTVGNRKMKNI